MVNATCVQYTIQANNYNIRNETLEGRAQMVVPVVMMTEGVHCGSAGAVFHSIEELGKYTGSWDGIPISVSHPQADGSFVSANSPEVIEKQTVGRIFHTFVDGKKLKAECWIDVEKIKTVSPLAYEMIQKMYPLEVSIGVFSDDEPAEGEWNGESYTFIAHNHRPDHLALLPGEHGACSWSDGAGIRANSNKVKEVNQLGGAKKEYVQDLLKTFVDDGFRAIVEKIQDRLNGMDNSESCYYLEDCYDDKTFVYFVRNQSSGRQQYYKKTYSLDSAGEISFSQESTPVAKKVSFEEISANQEGVKKNMEITKEVKAHVEALMASGKFKDEDKARLEGMDVASLEMFAPLLVVNTEQKEETPAVATTPTAFTKEDAIKVLQESMQSPDQCLSIFPQEIQEQLRSGLKLHQAQKEALITLITGYNKAYTDVELRTRSMEELTKMASFVPENKSDFSIFGANKTQQVSTNAEKPLIPMGVVGMKIEKE